MKQGGSLLAGYRRFIAYVYEYRKGKKQNNCGFIKVEARGNECTMEIHLHVEGLAEGETCKVYCFVRKEGLLHGILIGNCNTKKDWIECVLETDGTSIGGSGLPLAKIGGMILTTPSGGFYGTEWDDHAIRPENFKEDAEIRTAQKTQPSETIEIKEASKEEMPKEETIVEQKEETAQENLLMGENPIVQEERSLAGPEVMQQEEAKSEPEYRKVERKSEIAETESGKLELELTEAGKDFSEPQNEKENVLETNKKMVKSEKDSLSDFDLTDTESAAENREEQKLSQEVRIQSAPVKAASFSLPFGRPFCPFTDGDLNQCWRITPQDLVHFPRRQCALRNNRFLQYGYYNFGHLLLCRRSNGRCILGVPGSYDQQEQFMAGMFGFSCFKESNQIKVKKGRGGYWYRAIDPPACWGRDES